jgi:hypothetical protein
MTGSLRREQRLQRAGTLDDDLLSGLDVATHDCVLAIATEALDSRDSIGLPR